MSSKPESEADSHTEDDVMVDAPPSGSSADSPETKPEPAPSSPIKPEVDTTKDLEAMFETSDEEDYGAADDADLLAADADTLAPTTLQPTSTSSYSDPEVMYAFYQRLFPWRHLFQWLSHSPLPTPAFTHREFAFTLQNDVYLRYQSFPTHTALRKSVLDLKPSRFEIGPVYSADPRSRKVLKKAAFKPIEKELVFDIDLTDYDDVRTCCDKANICNKCWQFITVAIKILDVALKEDFGFKHVVWVYSGRRGAHAWISDARARRMDDSQRRAIANYLEVIKGGSQTTKKVNLWRPLHPHLTRSMEVLRGCFTNNILRDQDPWHSSAAAERLLALLPDRDICGALRRKWDAAPGRPSISKWADIDEVAKSGVSRDLNAQKLRDAKQDVVFEYMYPRLDVKVSTHMNHLLKSPFVVHPGTGRVCVPIDSERAEEFDPLGVPTVTQLLSEIDAWNKEHPGAGEETPDWDKTSLKPYVDYFKRFVAGLMKEEAEGKRVEREKGEKGPVKEEIKTEEMEF